MRLFVLGIAALALMVTLAIQHGDAVGPKQEAYAGKEPVPRSLDFDDHEGQGGDAVGRLGSGALNEPWRQPVDPPTGSMDSASNMQAMGSITVFSVERPKGPLGLVWSETTDGSAFSFDVHEGEWKRIFPSGEYDLISATSEGVEYTILGSPHVGAYNTASVAIELLGPKAFLLDLYGKDSPGKRLERANVCVELELNDLAGASIHVTSGDLDIPVDPKVHLDSDSTDPIATDSIRAWALANKIIPILLPGDVTGQSIRIQSLGYEDYVLEHLEGPGIYRVELLPIRRLHLSIRDDGFERRHFNLRVKAQDGRTLSSFENVRDGSRRIVPLKDEKEVLVDILQQGDLGTICLAETRRISLDGGVDTERELNLTDLMLEKAGGILEIVVESLTPYSGMERLRVALSPVGASSTADLKLGPTGETLEGWQAEIPLRRYSKEFDQVPPGNYVVSVEPIGIRESVAVKEDQPSRVLLRVPILCSVRIHAVGGSGAVTSQAQGALAWTILNSENKGSNETQTALYSENNSEAKMILDIAGGRAHFAEIVEGGWQFTAPLGKDVLIKFMGPRGFGARDLELQLTSEVMNASLVFSGL